MAYFEAAVPSLKGVSARVWDTCFFHWLTSVSASQASLCCSRAFHWSYNLGSFEVSGVTLGVGNLMSPDICWGPDLSCGLHEDEVGETLQGRELKCDLQMSSRRGRHAVIGR